ncbi:unnamed protein product [Calypogeia fissa]
MASAETVEAWEALFGEAKGEVESSGITSSSRSGVQGEFLPFLFSLSQKDAHHLRLSVSDFHSQTWQGDFSVQELQDIRDDVGIGEILDDLLSYLKSAFSSENVRFLLKELDQSTAGRLVSQKVRGTPFVSLSVKSLEGSVADEAKGAIAMGNFRAFKALSSSLASEKAQVAALKGALTTEKAKAEKLHNQIDASNLSFRSRRLNRNHSPLFATQQEPQEALPLPATVSGALKDGTEMAVPKASGNKSRVHVAPPSRRVKQRGTVIKESTD